MLIYTILLTTAMYCLNTYVIKTIDVMHWFMTALGIIATLLALYLFEKKMAYRIRKYHEQHTGSKQ